MLKNSLFEKKCIWRKRSKSYNTCIVFTKKLKKRLFRCIPDLIPWVFGLSSEIGFTVFWDTGQYFCSDSGEIFRILVRKFTMVCCPIKKKLCVSVSRNWLIDSTGIDPRFYNVNKYIFVVFVASWKKVIFTIWKSTKTRFDLHKSVSA